MMEKWEMVKQVLYWLWLPLSGLVALVVHGRKKDMERLDDVEDLTRQIDLAHKLKSRDTILEVTHMRNDINNLDIKMDMIRGDVNSKIDKIYHILIKQQTNHDDD